MVALAGERLEVESTGLGGGKWYSAWPSRIPPALSCGADVAVALSSGRSLSATCRSSSCMLASSEFFRVPS